MRKSAQLYTSQFVRGANTDGDRALVLSAPAIIPDQPLNLFPPSQLKLYRGGRMNRATIRVLLVDDYEPWRRLMHLMLQKRPELRVVGEASDGLEAVQLAQKLQPDLIVLDIGLRTVNGIEASSRIKKVAPKAKILFVSQNQDTDVVRAVFNNGAHGFILKADARGELWPALEAVIQGDTFLSKRLKDQISV